MLVHLYLPEPFETLASESEKDCKYGVPGGAQLGLQHLWA